MPTPSRNGSGSTVARPQPAGPYPQPIALLGRLGVDERHEGQRRIIYDNRDEPEKPLVLHGKVIDAASTAAWARIHGPPGFAADGVP